MMCEKEAQRIPHSKCWRSSIGSNAVDRQQGKQPLRIFRRVWRRILTKQPSARQLSAPPPTKCSNHLHITISQRAAVTSVWEWSNMASIIWTQGSSAGKQSNYSRVIAGVTGLCPKPDKKFTLKYCYSLPENYTKQMAKEHAVNWCGPSYEQHKQCFETWNKLGDSKMDGLLL